MSLGTYALVTLEGLKGYIGASGSGQDDSLERCIDRATSWLESQTNRKFITRGNTTEYHSVRDGEHTIRVGEWPIATVVTVHETSVTPRVYGATALLVDGTDYQVVKELGLIRRISSSEPIRWLTGTRAIKVVYTYGYASTVVVPEDLKQIALFVAVSMFKESDRARWGVSQVQDGLGMVTRYTGYLPGDMKEQLDGYRHELFDRTWENA
jgi:hypothetical protein